MGSNPGEEGRQRYRRQARLLGALANESRLMILHRLAEGESCVCDLAELTNLDQSTVSKHLALLKDRGVVDGERRGHHVYYRLTAPWVTELLRAGTAAASSTVTEATAASTTPDDSGGPRDSQD